MYKLIALDASTSAETLPNQFPSLNFHQTRYDLPTTDSDGQFDYICEFMENLASVFKLETNDDEVSFTSKSELTTPLNKDVLGDASSTAIEIESITERDPMKSDMISFLHTLLASPDWRYDVLSLCSNYKLTDDLSDCVSQTSLYLKEIKTLGGTQIETQVPLYPTLDLRDLIRLGRYCPELVYSNVVELNSQDSFQGEFLSLPTALQEECLVGITSQIIKTTTSFNDKPIALFISDYLSTSEVIRNTGLLSRFFSQFITSTTVDTFPNIHTSFIQHLTFKYEGTPSYLQKLMVGGAFQTHPFSFEDLANYIKQRHEKVHAIADPVPLDQYPEWNSLIRSFDKLSESLQHLIFSVAMHQPNTVFQHAKFIKDFTELAFPGSGITVPSPYLELKPIHLPTILEALKRESYFLTQGESRLTQQLLNTLPKSLIPTLTSTIKAIRDKLPLLMSPEPESAVEEMLSSVFNEAELQVFKAIASLEITRRDSNSSMSTSLSSIDISDTEGSMMMSESMSDSEGAMSPTEKGDPTSESGDARLDVKQYDQLLDVLQKCEQIAADEAALKLGMALIPATQTYQSQRNAIRGKLHQIQKENPLNLSSFSPLDSFFSPPTTQILTVAQPITVFQQAVVHVVNEQCPFLKLRIEAPHPL